MAEPTFSLSILPSSRNLFILVHFNCHHPLLDSRGTPDLCGEEIFNWVIFFDLLPLNDPDTHTVLHCSPGSPSYLTTFPLLPPLWSFLAYGRCFRTWVLITYQFFYLSLSLRSSTTTSVPPSFNFQKAHWDDFDSHCSSAEKYSSLSLVSAAALFTSLALNTAKSSIPFSRIKQHPKAWWSVEEDSAVSERCKTFAAAHRSDQDSQAYFSTSQHALSVIAKAKTEAWLTTCYSLSPKSNLKTVYSLFCSIAGSPSSSSSSPNFPNCSSPRESASVYAAYL